MDLPRTPAPPPVVAGRYRVGRLLGRGGMADVYAAVDERTGDEVAVKLFRDPAGHDPERSVADEARTLARLRHPGLVALLDAGEDDGWPYCVMTLVDGPTLAQRMADGPLDPAETARIGAAVAAALAHVHAQGVVHRDVKPANVLLTADGRPLLGDFGIARLVDATRVTRTSLTMGTASYLAPEQVTGGHLGPPVDVYGLGLVLLECLTGRREYPGPALESALARLHRRPALPADLPGGWAALLERMTADDPAARPTAGDAAAALAVLTARPDAPRSALPLAPAAQEDDGRAFPVDLPAVPAPRTRQRRRRAGLVGALLLAPAAVLATPSALWSGTAASGTGGAAAAPAATATIPAPVGTS
ncbi:MAG: serine/threonine protein kinase, partial [Actinomycetota bacterium]|nr:serine/threonine protein kinase [Actinomycetota bacterium]